ncbi:MAG: MBL fold metallo-hydrolase [Patescibacteria group bacterium]|jgi:competence protein ComEC
MSKPFLLKRRAIITCLVIIIISFGIGYWQSLESKDLRVWFADVGQGDGIIIRTPNQFNIIIDGGPNVDFIKTVDKKLPLTDQSIDLLVISHPDADHITGLVGLLKVNRVKQVLMTDAISTSNTFKSLSNLITENHIPVIKAEAGQEFIFGEVKAKVLWPPKNYQFDPKDLNQSSIVLEISYGKQDFLFTGDAPEDVELSLINNKVLNPVEVLKVSHHGSKSATSENLLKISKPQYAILSVGLNNKYGHPAPSIVNRLHTLGIQMFRTDYQGEILFKSSKDNLIIKAQN